MERYREIPHTADLAAVIYGRTMEELFRNAAYAMFGMMADLKGLGTGEKAEVTAEAPDTESLLVAWLNELLFAAYSKDMIFSEFRVLSLEDGKMTGEAMGEKLGEDKSRIKAEIKAATYHDIRIVKTEEGYEITIVFDV